LVLDVDGLDAEVGDQDADDEGPELVTADGQQTEGGRREGE
jgi:hypothetical protein